MYTIIGATGNTGKPLTEALLNAGKKVRIVSRDPEKAKELVQAGAELIVGDSTDRDTLTQAFKGAEAAYVLIPANPQAPDFYGFQQEISDHIAEAIEASGLKNVVTLSSVGAHLPANAGVVQGLHYMEERLNQIDGVNILHLRPGYFMENTLGMVPLAKFVGIMGSPVNPSLEIPMIATRDIGEYAAKRLLALDFSGKGHQYLLGSRNVQYAEVAKIFGSKIGKPELQYVPVPAEEMKKSMLNEWGASESFADKMLEFVDTMNNGQILEEIQRDQESTTPTSIEDFSEVWAAVYNS